jgi:hypothetical protein
MSDTQQQKKRKKKRKKKQYKTFLINRSTLKSTRKNWAACYAGVHIDEQGLIRKALAFYNHHLHQQSKLIHCLETNLASGQKEPNV